MTIRREVKESPMKQGVDEKISYTLDTTPWGTSPTSISVSVFDITDGGRTSCTSDVMPTNSPSADSDDVITLSPLYSLSADHQYRVEIKFTCSGNVFEPYCIVEGEN